VSADALDLLDKMLTLNPPQRLTAEGVIFLSLLIILLIILFYFIFILFCLYFCVKIQTIVFET